MGGAFSKAYSLYGFQTIIVDEKGFLQGLVSTTGEKFFHDGMTEKDIAGTIHYVPVSRDAFLNGLNISQNNEMTSKILFLDTNGQSFFSQSPHPIDNPVMYKVSKNHILSNVAIISSSSGKLLLENCTESVQPKVHQITFSGVGCTGFGVIPSRGLNVFYSADGISHPLIPGIKEEPNIILFSKDYLLSEIHTTRSADGSGTVEMITRNSSGDILKYSSTLRNMLPIESRRQIVDSVGAEGVASSNSLVSMNADKRVLKSITLYTIPGKIVGMDDFIFSEVASYQPFSVQSAVSANSLDFSSMWVKALTAISLLVFLYFLVAFIRNRGRTSRR